MEKKSLSDDCEMRSEKVRKIMGEIPPALVRWGMVIIILIFIILLVAICILPSPYTEGESIIQYFIK